MIQRACVNKSNVIEVRIEVIIWEFFSKWEESIDS